MQGVEHLNASVTRRRQDLTHVLDASVGLGNSLQAVPYLAALGDEVVVRIDYDKAGHARAVFHLVNSAPTRPRVPQFRTRFTYDAAYVTLHSMVVKPRVGVIGAGPGGIAMGIQLSRGGYDFTIFERGDGFGGTWRHNTYPGAACDVPSHFYSFSFALNPYWSKTYANQPEILAYLECVADDHGLGPHLKAGTAVTSVRWSAADSQ